MASDRRKELDDAVSAACREVMRCMERHEDELRQQARESAQCRENFQAAIAARDEYIASHFRT